MIKFLKRLREHFDRKAHGQRAISPGFRIHAGAVIVENTHFHGTGNGIVTPAEATFTTTNCKAEGHP